MVSFFGRSVFLMFSIGFCFRARVVLSVFCSIVFSLFFGAEVFFSAFVPVFSI